MISSRKGNGGSSAAEDTKNKPVNCPVEHPFVAAVYVTIPVTILFAIVRVKCYTVTEGAIVICRRIV